MTQFQFPFPSPLGVFLQMAQLERPVAEQAALVEPRVQALPFGILVSYQVRARTFVAGDPSTFLIAQLIPSVFRVT